MKLIVLVTALCLGTSLAAQTLRVSPIDQAAQDPSLVEFREQLLNDIAARDVKAVLNASCDGIYLSHGGNGGHDEFMSYLTLPDENVTDEYRLDMEEMRDTYWTQLEKTLRQPGSFNGATEFWMPVYWQADLPESVDAYEAYFVAGDRVNLRKAPNGDGKIIGSLSHELVTVSEYDEEATYLKIQVADGRSGYMHQDYLCSAVGYRAAFTKSDSEEWQLCIFIAGD
ncbi:MAG: hypothetical protein COB16_10615 [Rhodobacteraceae bacterium]|nr:MAG: hypothetical protein COB16_10615 [Paracoccaceae bacterium]